MGALHVHEFMTLDGVVDAPIVDVPVRVRAPHGRAHRRRSRAAAPASCSAARRTRCSSRRGRCGPSTTIPGAPFFNDTTKYVVSSTLTDADVAQLDGPRRLRRRRDPPSEARRRRRSLRQWQRHACAGDARRRPRRRAAPVRVPAHPRRTGPRLFPEDAAPADLTLVASEAFDTGVVYLSYAPSPDGPTDGYVRRRPRRRRAQEEESVTSDIEAIRRLHHTYAYTFDGGDFDAFAASSSTAPST